MGFGVHTLGFIYFGWGLLLAICACSPRLGCNGGSGRYRQCT
ncbi:MAG: hypothetical protein ACRES9_07310 [Gammaproteobacteria bacterium]